MALTPQQQSAVMALVTSDQEQASILQNSFGGDIEQYAYWFRDWWSQPENYSAWTPTSMDQAIFQSFNWQPGQPLPAPGASTPPAQEPVTPESVPTPAPEPAAETPQTQTPAPNPTPEPTPTTPTPAPSNSTITSNSGLSERQVAALTTLTQDPEQASILQNSFNGDLKAYGDWFIGWWAGPEGNNYTPTNIDREVFASFSPSGSTERPGSPALQASENPVDWLQTGYSGPNSMVTTGMSPEQIEAFRELILNDPTGEQQAIFNQLGGDLTKFRDNYVQWWNSDDNLSKTTPSAADKKIFDSLDLAIEGGDGQEIPWDQAFAQTVINDYLLPDIAKDADRQKQASEILSKYGASFDASRQLVNDLTVQTPGVDGKMQTKILQDELAENKANVDAKLGFLNEQITSLQSNLSGELAAKLGNLTTLMGELGGAINQATTQKDEATRVREAEELSALETQIAQQQAALAEATGKMRTAITDADRQLNERLAAQINEQLQYLTQEATTRRTALTQATGQMSGAIDTNTQARKQALANKIAQDLGALTTEVQARQVAIDNELASLRGANTAQDQARRAALETEKNQLLAAQEPINAIRIEGADALGAAVNLGVQSERDRIEGQAALNGYIGGSTGTDAALARAGIGGRQAAATAMTSAKLENAQAKAGILGSAANAERSIADQTAANNFDVDVYGSKQNRGLADYDSGTRKAISDADSAYNLSIDEDAAKAQLDLSYWDANEGRLLTDAEAAARRGVQDAGSLARTAIAQDTIGKNFQLTNADAQAYRDISDFAGAEERKILNTGTLNRFNNAYENADLNLDLAKYGATEKYAINNTGATDLRKILDYGATETYGIKSGGADKAMDFFSADLNRRIGALGLPSAAAQAEFEIYNAADKYGRTGLDNALNTLPFFFTNGSQAPSTQTPTQLPNTTAGDSMQNIGAGLVGAGLNYWLGKSAGTKTPTQQDLSNPVYGGGGGG